MQNQAGIGSKQAPDKELAQFEAQAYSDGMLDADGAFAQDSWEFELDTLQDSSREALLTHLERSPGGHKTALYLKGHLMQSQEPTFTPFDE